MQEVYKRAGDWVVDNNTNFTIVTLPCYHWNMVETVAVGVHKGGQFCKIMETEVLTTLIVNTAVFWDVTPCRLV
jgi:hypothetical protein